MPGDHSAVRGLAGIQLALSPLNSADASRPAHPLPSEGAGANRPGNPMFNSSFEGHFLKNPGNSITKPDSHDK
jgi:hypothetical protein